MILDMATSQLPTDRVVYVSRLPAIYCGTASDATAKVVGFGGFIGLFKPGHTFGARPQSIAVTVNV